jgi:hypothetical protein
MKRTIDKSPSRRQVLRLAAMVTASANGGGPAVRIRQPIEGRQKCNRPPLARRKPVLA